MPQNPQQNMQAPPLSSPQAQPGQLPSFDPRMNGPGVGQPGSQPPGPATSLPSDFVSQIF